MGFGEGPTEGLGAAGVVGIWVIFTFSSSFSGASGFGLDGMGIASNKPCKAIETSSIGRIQDCKGAGKFFKK